MCGVYACVCVCVCVCVKCQARGWSAEPKITSGQRSISVQTTRRSGQRQCHADNMSGHGTAPANAISMAFGALIVYIA